MTVDSVFVIWTGIVGEGFILMIFAVMISHGTFSVIFDRFF